MDTPVTLKMIAKRCGLALSTVSMALKGHPEIARDTAEHVQNVARELGYKPNPLFSALGTKAHRKNSRFKGAPIALIMDTEKVLTSDTLAIRNSKSRAEVLGYHLDTFNLSSIRSLRALKRQLLARGVCGILVGRLEEMARFTSISWDEFSVISFGRKHSVLPYHTVTHNIFQATTHCWTTILNRGYKRIGAAICQHQPSHPDDGLRLGAILACHHQFPQLDRIPPFLGHHEDYEAYRNWYSQWQPDAILGFHAGQNYSLRYLNIHPPEKVAFACLHLSLGDSWSQSISGMMDAVEDEAVVAVNWLDQMIRYRQRGTPESPQYLVLDQVWHEGVTLPDKAESLNLLEPVNQGKVTPTRWPGAAPGFAACESA